MTIIEAIDHITAACAISRPAARNLIDVQDHEDVKAGTVEQIITNCCVAIEKKVSEEFQVRFVEYLAQQQDAASATEDARGAASLLVPSGVFGTFDDANLSFTVDCSEMFRDENHEDGCDCRFCR